jgi:hypothetical protein
MAPCPSGSRWLFAKQFTGVRIPLVPHMEKITTTLEWIPIENMDEVLDFLKENTMKKVVIVRMEDDAVMTVLVTPMGFIGTDGHKYKAKYMAKVNVPK